MPRERRVGSNPTSPTSSPAPFDGNGHGPGPGIEIVEPPEPLTAPDGYVIVAEPGEAFGVNFSVSNDGTLPITVLGLVQNIDFSTSGPWRWTTVRMLANPQGSFPGIDESDPFQATELAPGDYLNLYLVGRAGACAAGRGWQPEDGSFSGTSRLPIAYSVVGLPAAQEVELPFQLWLPHAPDCLESEN